MSVKSTYSQIQKYLIILLLFTGCIFACKKVEDLLTFKIRNEVTFIVPSTVGVNTPFSVPVPDVQTNASQSFQSNNTHADKVRDITLESLNLTIVSPVNGTFRPLKSIRIYISGEGLEEKLIAYKNDIPTTVGNTLVLDTTGEKLDMYIKKEKYNLRTETVVREAIFNDVEIKAQMAFRITANI